MKAHLPLNNRVRREIRREATKVNYDYIHKVDCAVLYTLYSRYGWGAKRLRKFYDEFNSELDGLAKRYEFGVEEAPDICELKLKDIGVNLTEWENENE